MSHVRPGLELGGTYSSSTDPAVVPVRDVSVNIVVKNNGNTPAVITEHLIQVTWNELDLPSSPVYHDHEIRKVRASLVKDDSITVFANFRIPVEVIEGCRTGARALFLYGYTDYVDKFGCRHRVGYARVYAPSNDMKAEGAAFAAKLQKRTHTPEDYSNLSFVLQGGYNYDRRRRKGEGGDWQEKV